MSGLTSFGCCAVDPGLWPERVTESALMFLLVSLSRFSTAVWDLEINLFRKGYLSVLLDRVKMRDQVGYVRVEY